jgi:hypothetical protein
MPEIPGWTTTAAPGETHWHRDTSGALCGDSEAAAKCDWHLHEIRFACRMFSTMVVRLIQESATERHYTLREALLRAFAPVKDPTDEQVRGTTPPHRQFLTAGGQVRRVRGVWKLIPIKFKGDEHDSE